MMHVLEYFLKRIGFLVFNQIHAVSINSLVSKEMAINNDRMETYRENIANLH